MKYIFTFILLIHGFIHVMGFAKAFGYGNITNITKEISKPLGMLWLTAAILILAVSVLYLLKKESWPMIGIAAAIISQVLIITVWKDAKFGTAANVMVLLVAIPAFANFRFNKMVKKEVVELLAQPMQSKTIVSEEMLNGLPAPVQRWLRSSGIVGKEKIQFTRLRQHGIMRTKPDGSWMDFDAVQYFNVNEPTFNWQTKVQMMPFVYLSGRDKFENGKGEMKIKLLSLFKVADVGNNEKVNISTMIRYLAEMSWFPTAALNDYIMWEAIDSTSAKAVMTYKGITVSGIFQFNERGDMIGFLADRYKDVGPNATLEKWLVTTTDTKEFNGIRIPYKSEVTWKLKEGDFTWAKMELTELEFDRREVFRE
jgi:hypothetical protein